MSALALSRDRLEAARRAMDEASLALMRGDVDAAVRRCEPVYADLRDSATVFRHDWQALDLLLGELVVIRGWCDRQRRAAPERLRPLSDAALNLRLAWLQGEEGE